MKDNKELMKIINRMDAKIDSVYKYIERERTRREMVTDSIELDNQDMMDVLRVSLSTLRRWRRSGLKSHKNPAGKVMYYLEDVIISIKTGLVGNKGFNKIKAIHELNAYRRGILHGSGIFNE